MEKWAEKKQVIHRRVSQRLHRKILNLTSNQEMQINQSS